MIEQVSEVGTVTCSIGVVPDGGYKGVQHGGYNRGVQQGGATGVQQVLYSRCYAAQGVSVEIERVHYIATVHSTLTNHFIIVLRVVLSTRVVVQY